MAAGATTDTWSSREQEAEAKRVQGDPEGHAGLGDSPIIRQKPKRQAGFRPATFYNRNIQLSIIYL